MGEPSQEKIRSFRNGQIIYKEGQKSPTAYMVKKGRVSLYRIINNRQVRIGTCVPGQIFGETAVITGEAYNANAIAEAPTDLLVLDDTTLKTLLLKCPAPMQRIVRSLLDRLVTLEKAVHDQPANNMFLSLAQVLELLHKALQGATGGNEQTGVSYGEYCRTARNVLLVTQLEIDSILERLRRVGAIEMREVKGSLVRTDLLGQKQSSDFVEDQHIFIKDPLNFITIAKNISKDIQEGDAPRTCDFEFTDLQGFADMVASTPDILYKKIAQHEIPENLFFFPRAATNEWAGVKGEEFFKRVKRKRLNIDELENVDDLVFVDNNTLREVFQTLGFHKVLVLYSGAGEEAQNKFTGCLSNKIADMVREESANRQVDDMELADTEGEAIELIRQVKGIAPKGS